MALPLLFLVIALALYTIIALHPRRFSTSFDMTGLGLALICYTILVLSGAF